MRNDAGPPARVLQTLEDTPFYVRSMLESSLLGERVMSVHETPERAPPGVARDAPDAAVAHAADPIASAARALRAAATPERNNTMMKPTHRSAWQRYALHD